MRTSPDRLKVLVTLGRLGLVAVFGLLGLLGASGCNAIRLNNYLLRQRFSRAGLPAARIEIPSGEMRYFAGGEGPPVLLLHGFGFGAVENWPRQGPAFAKHHHVIAPDLYWFGDSIPKVPIENARAEAEAVRELLDALHVERVDIVGASFGGLVALHFALLHPERVRKLVLVDAAGIRPTDAERHSIAANFDGERSIETLLMPTNLDALKRFLERVVYRRKPRLPDWVLRQVMTELGRNRAAKTRLCQSLDDDFFDEADLAKLHAQTLVLWGRNDPLLLVSLGERLARAIPGAQLVIFEDASHSSMLEQPTRFNELVTRFLDR